MAHRGRLNVLAHTSAGPTRRSCASSRASGRSTPSSPTRRAAPATSSTTSAPRACATTDAGEITVTLARQPEPPRGRRPGRRGPHARRADRPLDARRRPRPRRRAPDPDPRRRVVRGPGRRRGDAEPRGPRRLLDRRHAAPDREQPDRLHHRPARRPLDALLERPRQGLRHPDHPRQRRRPRGGDLGDPARARLPAALRPRRRRRPRRLPPLRPQRAGRAGVHAAADGRSGSPQHPTVREQFAAQLVEEGVVSAGRGRRRSSERVETMLTAAHERLKATFGARRAAGERTSAVPRRHGASGVVTAVPADRLRALERASSSPSPSDFTVHPKLARQLERRADGARRGRDRLGPGGGARLRQPARRGHPDPAHRPGHRARDVLAPAPRPPRRRAPASATRRSSTSPRRPRPFEVYNSPLSEYAARRLRVRLLGRRARGARALGGAVRRLRQRRADHHRPVHRRRPLEVGRDARG